MKLKSRLQKYEMAGGLTLFILCTAFENPNLESPLPAACPQTADALEGRSACTEVLPDGSKMILITDRERFGDEVKRQLQLLSFSSSGKPLGKKTIRQKTAYLPGEPQKMRSQFFDIVTQPNGKKATREIILYEYYKTQALKKASWSRYEQLGHSGFAGIKSHDLFLYSERTPPRRFRKSYSFSQ